MWNMILAVALPIIGAVSGTFLAIWLVRGGK